MHGGSIDSPDTAAGRVYRALKDRMGRWVDGWTLSQEARVTAVSTRVSEVRSALCRRGGSERVESEQQGRGWFYRLVMVEPGEQLDLVA